jgi:predicted NAD/FAD-binding protein
MVARETLAMTDKEGTLHLQPNGRWAIIRPGRSPVAILEGEIFEIEVRGKMRRARMERRRDGQWVTAEGYELRDGARAGFYDGREKFAKPLTE